MLQSTTGTCYVPTLVSAQASANQFINISPWILRMPTSIGSKLLLGGEPWRSGRLLLALAASMAAASVTAPYAQAGILPFRKKKKPPPPVVNKEIGEFVSYTAAIYWPILQNLGFSGAAGYATAYALKVRARNLQQSWPCAQLSVPFGFRLVRLTLPCYQC